MARVGRSLVLGAVAAGGALGALGRYVLEERFAPADPATFPAATLAINLSGALALGLVITLVLEVWPPTRLVRPFLGIGLLGAFTTMSGLVLELQRMAAAGALGGAVLYAVASVAGGLVAMVAGIAAARAVPRLARRGRR